MGFKLKLNKLFLLISIIIIVLFSVSLVSASTDNDNLTLSDNTIIVNQNIEINNDESYSSSNIDTEELKSTEKNWIINQRNFNMFFDNTNTLKHEYGGQKLTFDGSFNDKGIITIDSPNTKITGRNTLFNNTVFNLKAEGIVLSDLKIVCDKEFMSNEGSCILVNSNNVTVKNNQIEYNVPHNVTGFGIYSNSQLDDISDVKLINNNVHLVGDALESGFNYGVLLRNTENAIVSGNVINCSLPLKNVDWSNSIYGSSSMDSVAVFVADSCNNLSLSNNIIHADVNGRNGGEATLDVCLIYKCHNSTIENNIITEDDYYTPKGTQNYLYGLDLYLSENVIIFGNDIHIFTTGGKNAHGTAYAIQVTGQAKNVLIAFNNISSYSNGPNIGIYSQNFFGETELEIISNFINVTGNAYTGDAPPSWALVAGIEIQDSDDVILNNTIIVNTVTEFKPGQNVYGISYSQSTGGGHKYNIQYNNVSTNSQYAVSLKGSTGAVQNSIIANNILKTSRAGGNRAAIMSSGRGNIIANNTDGSVPLKRMTADEYTNTLKNYFKSKNNGESIGFGGEGHSLINNGNSVSSGLGVGNNGLVKNNIFGKNPNNSKSQSRNGNVNSTHYTYGSSGIDIASSSASSGTTGKSSDSDNAKSYEVTKQIKQLDEINYAQAILMILISLGLLVLGYYKKEHAEEY